MKRRGQSRAWLPEQAAAREAAVLAEASPRDTEAVRARLDELVADNRRIHERECLNLNPATNVMSPRAEAVLSEGLGTRASLGHPGDKYETGLEAIEALEVHTAALACEVFDASFAEIRVGSGALANQYAFMSSCQPGDSIIVPPPTIGGHVTHNTAGVAGLLGLQIHEAPIDAARYTVDVAGVAALAREVRPSLISVGSSLNLNHHPVADLREVADEVEATLLFDAAHLCGMIAGGQWPNPLVDGAHLMSFSTYKSLGGPPGGLLVTNDAERAERIDAIAYPGITANFDAARTTALAFTLADCIDFGAGYADAMREAAAELSHCLVAAGLPMFEVEGPAGPTPTLSHQFAIRAERWGGGQAAAARLRHANLLACGIGLPDGEGLRIGTPEAVRWGMTGGEMPRLAELIAAALLGDEDDLPSIGAAVTEFRAPYDTIQFCA